jgi:hypothetical protein
LLFKFSGEKQNGYLETEEKPLQVKALGCGHAWQMDLRKILIIGWFVFYGEEEFCFLPFV